MGDGPSGKKGSRASKLDFAYNYQTVESAIDSLRNVQHTNDIKYARDAVDAISWYISTGRSSADFDRQVIDADPARLLSAIGTKSGSSEQFVSRAKRYLKNPESRRPDTFERIPIAVTMGGGTAAEKRQAQKTVTDFINGARVGERYSVGGGIGSSGASFTIVNHRRSPNGMGIKWVGSNSQPVALSRANVRKAIANGAKKTRR